jgi:hypothetical protein
MATEKYMFLKNTGLKVPLKAKNGYFDLKSEKYKVNLDESIERLFIFHLYGDKERVEVVRWLMEFVNKRMTPQDADDLIAVFENKHPVEKIGDQPFENYPLYATKDGMSLPIPGHCCIISSENEKELMEIVCKRKKNALIYLQIWFEGFRERYGLDYWKPCKDQQNFYLAESFLNQHGICTKLMCDEEIIKAGVKSSNRWVMFFIMIFLCIYGLSKGTGTYGFILVGVIVFCIIIGVVQLFRGVIG